MFKKNWLNFVLLLSGIVFLFIGLNLIFKNEFSLEYNGIFIGIGTGLIAAGSVNMFTKFYYYKNPQFEKQKNIEIHDERNTLIRLKAKSKTNDISKWLIFSLAMITIAARLPLWITLSLLVIFLFNAFLQVYLINKYSK